MELNNFEWIPTAMVENRNTLIFLGLVVFIIVYSKREQIMYLWNNRKSKQEIVKEETEETTQFDFSNKPQHMMVNTIEALDAKQNEIAEQIVMLKEMNIKKLEEIKKTKAEINNTAMVLKGHFEELIRKERIIENNLRLISDSSDKMRRQTK